MNSDGENLRVRLVAVSAPRGAIRTVHKDTFLNASELKHVICKEHLKRVLPKGFGVHINICKKSKSVTLHAEKNGVAILNGEPMLANQSYPLTVRDVKLLHIGDILFRTSIIRSHF